MHRPLPTNLVGDLCRTRKPTSLRTDSSTSLNGRLPSPPLCRLLPLILLILLPLLGAALGTWMRETGSSELNFEVKSWRLNRPKNS